MGNDLLNVILISFFAGIVGTCLGGLIIVLFKRPKEVFFHSLTGFAAGIMLAITCFSLIPGAINEGNKSLMFNGFFSGIVVFLLLDRIISHVHKSGKINGDASCDDKMVAVQKLGLLMAIGIGLHDFPEGLAIGSGFAARPELGITIGILIGIHHIAEGLAVAAPIYAGGCSKRGTLVRCFIISSPMVLGAIIGFLIGEISKPAVSICLGFAAGAMFFITCDELIPECHMETEKYGHIPILSIVIGFVVGLIIS